MDRPNPRLPEPGPRRRRVAVTGIGVVSAVGVGRESFWEALLAGSSGVSPLESFPTEGYRTHIGAEIKDFKPRQAYAYAEAASAEALKDAGLGPAALDPLRTGVSLGTTSGESAGTEAAMERHLGGCVEELWKDAFTCAPGSVPSRLARHLGLRGPALMITTACSAGNAALGCAFDKIAGGGADVMLAGGVDVFSRLPYAGFNRLLAIAPERCAPFSKDRRGLVPGEGSAVLILEDWDRAAARKAPVYAEMLGYGMSSDAAHVTLPSEGGVFRAMESCLKDCGLEPDDVDYLSAHGTGTPLNDKTETRAVKKLLGPRAPKVPISSIKSMLGHAMGAASALEAAACCLALKTGRVPPTINFTPGDADCDLDYVPDKARKTDPEVVLSNAFAFGGSNAVVAFSRPPAGGQSSSPRPRALSRGPEERVVITGIGISVPDGDPVAAAEKFLPDTDLSYADVPIAHTMMASKRAFDDAGLDAAGLGFRGGVVLDSSGEIGSHFRLYSHLAKDGPAGIEPRWFPTILANAAASRTAIAFGLKWLCLSIGGCFPAGESAVARAYDLLRRSPDGVLLAGGTAAGSSMMVLETLSGARKRGARIYAEILSVKEGFDPTASPSPDLAVFDLADAVKDFSEAQNEPRTYCGKGAWGGTVEIALGRL